MKMLEIVTKHGSLGTRTIRVEPLCNETGITIDWEGSHFISKGSRFIVLDQGQMWQLREFLNSL